MKTLLRRVLLLILDAFLLNIALITALILRFDGKIPLIYKDMYIHTALIFTALKLAVFYLMGIYRSLWEHASIEELAQITGATLLADLIVTLLGIIIGYRFPFTIYISTWITSCMLVGASRLGYRVIRRVIRLTENQSKVCKKAMIIGAGSAGSMIIKEMKSCQELFMKPVIVIDDDPKKNRKRIHGVKVVSDRYRIRQMAEKYKVDEIIVAIPSAPRKELINILKLCKETCCKLKKLPGYYELINEAVSVKHLKEVSIEDLLGREEVKLNTEEISGYLHDEVVMVTGGGGSIGSELCRQIARFEPKKLIIFDIYENNAYDLQHELQRKYRDKLDLEVVIGSVRDRCRLKETFERYRPGVVFHAAAHKHVPFMESNPSEAVKNNVLGTLNTARRADDYGCKKFVLISTDKAVNPTNIMGASKRLAEIIIQTMNNISKTEFVAVRFGNVLGSNGSVIPLFKKQIEAGGPVTVTHPEIIRYFMTIPEAARLVIQAGGLATGGEVFVLDMGNPVKIDDLARDLIRLSGLEPDVDIKIEYSGLRPGEKLYEELLMDEEGLQKTSHEKIFIGKQSAITFQEVIMCVKALESSMGSNSEIKECMARLVPTYRYIPDLQQAVGQVYNTARSKSKEYKGYKESKKLKVAAQN